MREAQRNRAPEGAPGNALAGGFSNKPNDTPFARASVALLERELAIIVQAAHRVASGHGLAWPDYERVHTSHQHLHRGLGPHARPRGVAMSLEQQAAKLINISPSEKPEAPRFSACTNRAIETPAHGLADC
jgi:hypothetical protein